MGIDLYPADLAILELLRQRNELTIVQLVRATGVTATAVRQRLGRLLVAGYIRRAAVTSEGRGRPSHKYFLTAKGRRFGGTNFNDLAIVLWQELRAVRDPEIRRGLLQRISQRLANAYRTETEGQTLRERMESVAQLFADRQVPFDVEAEQRGEQLPVLTARACPYPELAEQDRSLCAMERLLFTELLGQRVSLSQCRLDGDPCCSFQVRQSNQPVQLAGAT